MDATDLLYILLVLTGLTFWTQGVQDSSRHEIAEMCMYSHLCDDDEMVILASILVLPKRHLEMLRLHCTMPKGLTGFEGVWVWRRAARGMSVMT